jgi:hypothetical protein
MTREKLLEYITTTHKAALKRAGVDVSDTPENLAYVLNDAMQHEDAATQKAVADREIAQLIIDKKAAMKTAAVEELEVENVSN